MVENEYRLMDKMAHELIDMVSPKCNDKDKGCKEKHVNLILDGGLFNGSFMMGSLYYVRALETRGFMKVHKLSAVSVGTLCGLFYLVNKLELFERLYTKVYDHYKTHFDLLICHPLIDGLASYMPENVLDLVNHRLYISYYDMQKGRKITKHTYACVADLLETIKRSCYVSYVCGAHMFYKGRYIDGIFPHVFDKRSDKQSDKRSDKCNDKHSDKRSDKCNDKCKPKCNTIKNLHIDLTKHLFSMICVKDESNNFYRMNVGLIDMHLLWFKKQQHGFCHDSTTRIWKVCWMRFFIEYILYRAFLLFFVANKILVRFYTSFMKTYLV